MSFFADDLGEDSHWSQVVDPEIMRTARKECFLEDAKIFKNGVTDKQFKFIFDQKVGF